MATYTDMLAAGLTPRRINHWTATGYLRPDATHPGSGNNRQWPHHEFVVGRTMARLVDAGLTPEAAHRFAPGAGGLIDRGLIEHIIPDHYRAPGVNSGHLRPEQVWRITRAGQLVIDLLKEAGIWGEYAAALPAAAPEAVA